MCRCSVLVNSDKLSRPHKHLSSSLLHKNQLLLGCFTSMEHVVIEINKKITNFGKCENTCAQIWSPVSHIYFFLDNFFTFILLLCFYSLLEKRRHSTKESQSQVSQDSSLIWYWDNHKHVVEWHPIECVLQIKKGQKIHNPLFQNWEQDLIFLPKKSLNSLIAS